MKFIAIFLKNKIIVYLVVVLFGVILYNLIKYKEGITGNSVVQKNTPICNLMTKNDCLSNAGYCDWNSKLYQCSNKHNCYDINNKSGCNNQNNCMWDNSMNKCNSK
jgi:hypothetical protein